jgi:hypothetical protein
VALVATSAVAVLLDLIYFHEIPAFLFLSDYLTFFFAIIWISYFWKARRVRLVFIDKSWAYTSYSAIRMLGPDEKRRLRKRALITAVVTFVVFLLIAGPSLKDEQEQLDISLFSLPLFCSFIAAVIAWYLPIRKKKPISVDDKMINTVSDKRDTKT